MLVDFSAHFNRIDLVYQTIDGIPLEAAVLIPKSLIPDPSKSYPVLVHFHGGALIVGTNPDPSFFAQWIIDLATTTPAIVISPAYRLLPESSGADILADVSTFFTWLHTSFPSSLRSALSTDTPFPTPDLSRIAAVGESAGGYLSIQAGLLFNAHARIKAVGAAYPAQYPDAEAYNQRKLGNAEAEAVVDGYLERVRRGEMPTRVSSPWPRGKELVEAMCATGRHREMMGGDERLGITGATRVAREGGWEVPAVWVIQGEDDDLVPKAGADFVVETMREVLPDVPVKYTVEPGPHLLDLDCGMDVPWIKEGVEFMKKYWL
ncbi:Alpha/Beta hydrolase protein [Podospora aff. communis PSN243]|uniref:Alpha/Beta hydrolase protein n=1 Tax=Podospora aff. communis PSN243 TaxID=3040156 RepID=A0AAV9GPG7_9PEZI|nr:Alpha/Beta hydrolase protein [Podospora aff. communis PSN243]